MYIGLQLSTLKYERPYVEKSLIRPTYEECFEALKTFVIFDFVAICEEINCDPEEEEKARYRNAKTIEELNNITLESDRVVMVLKCEDVND